MQAVLVDEKKKALRKAQTQVRDMSGENEELDEDMAGLEAAVLERERLVELQGVSGGSVKEQAKLVADGLMMQRKLVELARAQTHEIEMMREELVRLRARTFPSFAQLQEPKRMGDQRV